MKSISAKPNMKMFWFFFLLMLFLHQDFWNWSSQNPSLLGIPVGLFYHAIFSIACSLLGAWAVIRAWSEQWEKYAEEVDESADSKDQHASL